MSPVCRVCLLTSVKKYLENLSPDADSFYENTAQRNLGNVTVALLKEERSQYRTHFFFLK